MKKAIVPAFLLCALILCGLSFCAVPKQSPKQAVVNTQPPAAATSFPTILRVFPHDTSAFTQGLVYINGLLYESDGLYGRSALRIVDTMGIEKKRIAVSDVFAEGLAFIGGKFHQLTWRENAALVYDSASFSPLGRYTYDGEGWGLAVLDGMFVMSNGSDSLYFRDPLDFRVVRSVGVRLDGVPLRELNELETARGLVWANIWQTERIAAIDPQSGVVKQIVDCSELCRKAEAAYRGCDVLNGIAYDDVSDIFYLTGKNWPFVFAVRM